MVYIDHLKGISFIIGTGKKAANDLRRLKDSTGGALYQWIINMLASLKTTGKRRKE